MQQLQYISSNDLDGSWKSYDSGRPHALHSICSRTGSFPPEIPRYFILRYSREGDVVFDPFSGKGTSPLEACIHGRVGIGNDLAPEAYVLTRAKVRPVSIDEVRHWVSENRSFIEGFTGTDAPDEVKVFYSKYTLKQLLAARELLINEDDDTSNFIKAVILGILHGSSTVSLSVRCSHSFSMSPNYVRNSISEMGLIKPRRNLLECLMVKAERVLSNGLPVMRGYAYNSDARRSPLDDGSVDLVVTSPPYLTMQTYAWDNWLRLWFLGYDYHEVARRLFHTSSLERFCQFMRETLEEIHRVLREGGRCFIVIGMVKLKGVSINMAELIAPIAERAGLHPVRIIADQIPKASKYLMYLRTDQGVSRELILELIKGDDIRSAERSGVPEAI